MVENARVGGGRIVDRLQVRWGDGSDEWYNRDWLQDDVGRDIVPVDNAAGDEEGI